MAASARKLGTCVLGRRLLPSQCRQSGHVLGTGNCSMINLIQQTCRRMASQHEPKHPSPSPLQTETNDTNTTSETKSLYQPSEIFERINWTKLLDPAERDRIQSNLKRRYAQVDLGKILKLYKAVSTTTTTNRPPDLLEELIFEVLKIPNDTHPAAWSSKDDDMDANVIHLEGERSGEKQEFYSFCKNKNLLRTENLGNLAGRRGYFLKGPLAELEQALIRFTIDALVKNGFELLSVPDILYPRVIESCGFPISDSRNQIYFLPGDPAVPNSESCLSGTSEMAIGGFLQNQVFTLDQLPLKLAAVSRCYRAENSSSLEEAGIYRVHHFTKVEMFGVTSQEKPNHDDSYELQESFRQIQQDLFNQCGFHYRVLEMPPTELGSSAHRKIDIEAWMPGRKMYGEISSCSNCTDYQSRRLNIRYVGSDGRLRFVHTVNGTACAVPRMLISLVENFQLADGTVDIPSPIQHFMTRSWSESAAANPQIESNFLRTKSQMDRVTSEYS